MSFHETFAAVLSGLAIVGFCVASSAAASSRAAFSATLLLAAALIMAAMALGAMGNAGAALGSAAFAAIAAPLLLMFPGLDETSERRKAFAQLPTIAAGGLCAALIITILVFDPVSAIAPIAQNAGASSALPCVVLIIVTAAIWRRSEGRAA